MDNSRTSKRPTHSAFLVEGEGEQAQWLEIGAAWKHEDGKGFNLSLKAIPTSGRLVIRERQVKTDGKRGQ